MKFDKTAFAKLGFGTAFAAALILTASTAQAGECPADKMKAGVRTTGEMAPKDVTDNELSAIDLGSQIQGFDNRRSNFMAYHGRPPDPDGRGPFLVARRTPKRNAKRITADLSIPAKKYRWLSDFDRHSDTLRDVSGSGHQSAAVGQPLIAPLPNARFHPHRRAISPATI